LSAFYKFAGFFLKKLFESKENQAELVILSNQRGLRLFLTDYI